MKRLLSVLVAVGPVLAALHAAPVQAQAFTIDRPALRATCAADAARPAHAAATEIVAVAEDQWARFGRGRVKETASDPVVIKVGGGQSEDVQAALGWEAVWSFWELAGQDRIPQYPYDVRRTGASFEAVKTPAWKQLEAVRTLVADPSTAKALSAAIKRAATPEYPWSAVFVSSVMIQAGLGRDRFTPAAAHAGYIQSAVEAVGRGSTSYAYRACDPATTAPRVGDVICSTRTSGGPRSFEAVLRGVETRSGAASASGRAFGFQSHCDVVTAVVPSTTGSVRVESVGGNVGDAVSKSAHSLSDAFLPSSRPKKTWIALLQLVPEPAPEPVAPPEPTPAPEPTPIPNSSPADPAAPVAPTPAAPAPDQPTPEPPNPTPGR